MWYKRKGLWNVALPQEYSQACLSKGQSFILLILPLSKLPLPKIKGSYGICNLGMELQCPCVKWG